MGAAPGKNSDILDLQIGVHLKVAVSRALPGLAWPRKSIVSCNMFRPYCRSYALRRTQDCLILHQNFCVLLTLNRTLYTHDQKPIEGTSECPNSDPAINYARGTHASGCVGRRQRKTARTISRCLS